MAKITIAPGIQFEPSESGFNAFRNESFVQDVCLEHAQEVAAIASAKSGYSFGADVETGRTRCHARAKCYIHGAITKREWYEGAYSDIADAAGDAAVALGGEKTWKRYEKKGRKK